MADAHPRCVRMVAPSVESVGASDTGESGGQRHVRVPTLARQQLHGTGLTGCVVRRGSRTNRRLNKHRVAGDVLDSDRGHVGRSPVAEPAGPGVVSGGGQVPRCLSARPGRPAQRAHPAEPTKPVICRKWSSMWKWSSKNSASSAAIWPTGIHSACRASSSACTAGRGALPRSK